MSAKLQQSIAETIRGSLERLTPTERKPALALLANYPVAGLETVAQFAKRAEVSGPTILRLVGKLGFESYPRFQHALRDELEARLQSPLTKTPARRGRNGRALDFLDEFAHALAGSVQASLRDVPRSEFDGAVGLIADARRPVYLLGGRFTASLALQLYLHLREMRPHVQLIDGQTATWVEHLLDMGRRDVLVVFDIRRYQDDVCRFASEAAARGSSVVLVTDRWLSPIASVARHVFALRTGAPSNWESFAAMSALVEALIARLNDRRWGDVKRRIGTLEELRGHLKAR
jgi:DNA-binding MurR/RpiR family transcriptional regulator